MTLHSHNEFVSSFINKLIQIVNHWVIFNGMNISLTSTIYKAGSRVNSNHIFKKKIILNDIKQWCNISPQPNNLFTNCRTLLIIQLCHQTARPVPTTVWVFLTFLLELIRYYLTLRLDPTQPLRHLVTASVTTLAVMSLYLSFKILCHQREFNQVYHNMCLLHLYWSHRKLSL